ncbi:unnamed protein product [Hymenolepis diminuta]|uniref:Uncharacterized protein n=1 Tax=Hymenolepis diminuta TaxID=6216 RepID=A0A564Y177_HYMDI|nr:unnamed protein product [Hymenolepis diminuta]
MGGVVMGMGNKEPSPRQLSQQSLQGHHQGGQQQMAQFMTQQHQQQQVLPGMVHHMGGGIDPSVSNQHQPRMPVSYGGNPMMATGGGNQKAHQHGTYSGPNSIEPAMGHQQQMQQQPGMQRNLSNAAAGPRSVPDAFGGGGNAGYQLSPANQPPIGNQGYGLAPPPMPGPENQGVRPPMVPQQQQQYYSPMPPTPYEGEGALTGLSPAVAPDQYLRVSYSSSASPMCSNPNINALNAGDPQATPTSVSTLQNPSPSQPQPQQQGKQQQTPQQQSQSQASPYATGGGTPHSAEQQYHMRQHASPYQASQQQSPMATGSQIPAGAQQQQYHTPATQAYSISEMNRYATTAGGSPMNTMRNTGQGQAAGGPQTAPSAQQQPAGGRMGGASGSVVPTGEERAIIWEGQLSLGGQIASYVQISADVSAPRLSFLWQNNSRLIMQLEHFDRESHWGQVLIHRASSFIFPTQLSVGFKSPENQAALQSRFQSPSPSSFTVAIVPPLNSFGQIPSGCIVFICLLCVGDNHFVGLVPRNAETFREDIVRRQMHRRQQPQQASQQHQYDSSLMEMQSQQVLQQQQPSSAYSVNTPSLPNTPNKMVRPTTATLSPVVNRVGNVPAAAAGMPPQQRIPPHSGMMVEDVADPQQQQQQRFMNPATNNMYQQQMTQQAQQQGPPPQQQQMQRQPPTAWQQQERPQSSAALPPEIMQQQQQRAYQSYQQPQSQQPSQMMSGGQQPQQQHVYHQGQGMPMGQSVGYMQQQQQPRMPQGQPRPQGAYSGGGIAQPRQQLRDASGRFQSTSNPAAGMASGNPEYHNAAAAAPPLPPAYTSNPMYEMLHPQQYGGPMPNQQQRVPSTAYARAPQPGAAMGMRGGAGYAAPGGPRMTAAGYPASRGAAMGPRGGGMSRMRGTAPAQHLLMGEVPPGMMYEGAPGIMEQQGQTQPQAQQGVFDPNMQPQPPQNQPNLFD